MNLLLRGIWQYLEILLVVVTRGALLASRGERPGKLLNILPTLASPPAQNCLDPNACGTNVDKPYEMPLFPAPPGLYEASIISPIPLHLPDCLSPLFHIKDSYSFKTRGSHHLLVLVQFIHSTVPEHFFIPRPPRSVHSFVCE